MNSQLSFPSDARLEVIPMDSHAEHFKEKVLGWFAAGHEVLWIPIIDVSPEPDGLARALAQEAEVGGVRLLRSVSELFDLPFGIKGWLFPAHLEDTDVVCVHSAPRVVMFVTVKHLPTGRQLSYLSSGEFDVRVQQGEKN